MGVEVMTDNWHVHTCQPQTKKKQEIFSRRSAATIYVSLPTSHQVPHLYI